MINCKKIIDLISFCSISSFHCVFYRHHLPTSKCALVLGCKVIKIFLLLWIPKNFWRSTLFKSVDLSCELVIAYVFINFLKVTPPPPPPNHSGQKGKQQVNFEFQLKLFIRKIMNSHIHPLWRSEWVKWAFGQTLPHNYYPHGCKSHKLLKSLSKIIKTSQ